MRRRQVVVALAAVTTGIAGCVGDETGRTDTPTATPADSGTPTQAQELGTIEYTVVNEDDESHRLEVTMENAEGRVVQETFEPGLRPGARVSSGSAGHEPGTGPYTLTFGTESTSDTYVWDVGECARIDVRVTITADGSLTIEQELCQN